MLVGDDRLVPCDLFRMLEACTRERGDFPIGQVAIGRDEKFCDGFIRMPARDDVAYQRMDLIFAELVPPQLRLQNTEAFEGR